MTKSSRVQDDEEIKENVEIMVAEKSENIDKDLEAARNAKFNFGYSIQVRKKPDTYVQNNVFENKIFFILLVFYFIGRY